MSTSATPKVNRDQLILQYLPQVRLHAFQIHRRCPPHVLLEDLVSEGIIGLLQAVDRFDAHSGAHLATLAHYRIRGAILDYLRALDPISRSSRALIKQRDALLSHSSQTEPPNPTHQELTALLEAHTSQLLSLDTSFGANHPMVDFTQQSPSTPDRSILRRELKRAIQSLPTPERHVLHHLLAGCSPNTIAKQLNLTASRVSQIKTRAIALTRTLLQSRPCANAIQ